MLFLFYKFCEAEDLSFSVGSVLLGGDLGLNFYLTIDVYYAILCNFSVAILLLISTLFLFFNS